MVPDLLGAAGNGADFSSYWGEGLLRILEHAPRSFGTVGITDPPVVWSYPTTGLEVERELENVESGWGRTGR